jgi:hypothetical protein
MACYLGSAGSKEKALGVIAGLVPAIHVLLADRVVDVDARDI